MINKAGDEKYNWIKNDLFYLPKTSKFEDEMKRQLKEFGGINVSKADEIDEIDKNIRRLRFNMVVSGVVTFICLFVGLSFLASVLWIIPGLISLVVSGVSWGERTKFREKLIDCFVAREKALTKAA